MFEMIVLFQFWKLGSPNRIEKVLLILPNSFDRIPRRTIFLLIFVSIRGLSAVGEHLLGDYPTVGSNGLESRTTKSEFFWVYFGVFLALLLARVLSGSGPARTRGASAS